MELNLSLTLLLSIGGMVASVASSIAIVKTKVSAMENIVSSYKSELNDFRDELNRFQSDERVRVALLEQNQEHHAKELAELRVDVKTIVSDVQAIKEAVLTTKGD